MPEVIHSFDLSRAFSQRFAVVRGGAYLGSLPFGSGEAPSVGQCRTCTALPGMRRSVRAADPRDGPRATAVRGGSKLETLI